MEGEEEEEIDRMDEVGIEDDLDERVRDDLNRDRDVFDRNDMLLKGVMSKKEEENGVKA